MSWNRAQQYSRILGGLTQWLGSRVAWLSLLLVLVTAMVVLLRYGFQTGSIALQESLLYINALMVAVGGAYTLQQDRHVRVDIFYARLSPQQKARVNCAGIVLLLIPLCGFILWASWDYVALSWRIRERSTEASGLPFVFLLKSLVPATAVLLLWQGLAELLRNLHLLFRDQG